MKMNAVVFFGRSFSLEFFGQVWGNLGKNHSHPQKFACSYTYAWKFGANISETVTILVKFFYRSFPGDTQYDVKGGTTILDLRTRG